MWAPKGCPVGTTNQLNRAYTRLSRKTPSLSRSWQFMKWFEGKWWIFAWTFSLSSFLGLFLAVTLNTTFLHVSQAFFGDWPGLRWEHKHLTLISVCFSRSAIVSQMCFSWVHFPYVVWITQICLPTELLGLFLKTLMPWLYVIRYFSGNKCFYFKIPVWSNGESVFFSLNHSLAPLI